MSEKKGGAKQIKMRTAAKMQKSLKKREQNAAKRILFETGLDAAEEEEATAAAMIEVLNELWSVKRRNRLQKDREEQQQRKKPKQRI